MQASEAARKASGDSWAPAGGTRPRRAAREHKRTSRRTRHGSAKRKKARAAKPGVALTLVLLLSEVLRRGGAGPKRLRAPRGAKAEREAAAKPPRPQWGLGLLARLRERPICAPGANLPQASERRGNRGPGATRRR